MDNSGDYISREEAFNAILKLVPKVDDDGYCWVIRGDAAMAIYSIPAADVRPVGRGKWINDRNGKYSASGDNFYCSVCKDPSLRAFGKPAKTNYCPNCGADMRISSTHCKNTVTTGEDREIFNLRAWLKNGKG